MDCIYLVEVTRWGKETEWSKPRDEVNISGAFTSYQYAYNWVTEAYPDAQYIQNDMTGTEMLQFGKYLSRNTSRFILCDWWESSKNGNRATIKIKPVRLWGKI